MFNWNLKFLFFFIAVRFGRVPKREKAKILAAMQKVNQHSVDKALSQLLENEHALSVAIAQAHEETCDYTRNKVAPLLEAARTRPIYAQCPPQFVSLLFFGLPFPSSVNLIFKLYAPLRKLEILLLFDFFTC